MNPKEIEEKSFKIIEDQIGSLHIPEGQKNIVIRVAHATADIDFALNCIIHSKAEAAGVRAVKSGKNIVTDVEMVRAGIRKTLLQDFGGQVRCFLYDDGIAEEAKKKGTTRSALAMHRALEFMEGGIVAIGNAPTALFELCRLIQAGKARPALVVGIPVGFVGAAESKQECLSLPVPYITNRGRRGGSPVAASIVNAILKMAAGGLL